MSERKEVILVLRAGYTSDWLGPYRVTQRASPRVVIVEMASDASHEELQGLDGVQAVLGAGESLAGNIAGTLTPGEAAFVEAYREGSRAKERPGDGLNWGAEGYSPPDPTLTT